MNALVKDKQQELIDWAIDKLQSYDNEKKLYNFSAIILSVLDVLCGMIAIFYAGMLATSVVTSIICGTIWTGRLIQIIKAERLAKALKILSVASLSYIAVRKKRSEYMKSFKNAIKNNPLTILFAALGGVVMGYASYLAAVKFFVALPQYAYILMAIGCAILTIVLIVLLGWDTAKSAVLRTAKKTLTKENYEKLVGFVSELEDKQKAEKEAQEKAEAHQKDVEKAKAIVNDYENAKKLLEEDKAMQSTDTIQ